MLEKIETYIIWSSSWKVLVVIESKSKWWNYILGCQKANSIELNYYWIISLSFAALQSIVSSDKKASMNFFYLNSSSTNFSSSRVQQRSATFSSGVSDSQLLFLIPNSATHEELLLRRKLINWVHHSNRRWDAMGIDPINNFRLAMLDDNLAIWLNVLSQSNC